MKGFSKTLLSVLIGITPGLGLMAELPTAKPILGVGSEGKGNKDASQAWKKLAGSDAAALISILGEMNDAGPVSANWLRGAVETIVDRTLKSGGELPLEDLGNFLLDTSNAVKPRNLAFSLIERVKPETAATLVPGLLNDPSPELRRLAVGGLADQAEALLKDGKKAEAAVVYRQALSFSREASQTQKIAEALTDLGQGVDLPRHFGFLMHWSVIGPFDNTDRGGFAREFPPEREIKLSSSYSGKAGKVSWRSFVSRHEYGKVDFNKPFGMLKQVVGYAYTEFESPTEQQVELRLGTKNAWKVWLNGKLLFERDEYHRGQRIDQYALPATLKAGMNQILVKSCQNEQEQSWTKEWEFQLRVCDSTGTAILAANRPPTPELEKKAAKK